MTGLRKFLEIFQGTKEKIGLKWVLDQSRQFTEGDKNYRGDRKKEALPSKGANRDFLKGRGRYYEADVASEDG